MSLPAPNTFAGAALDRAGHLRADAKRIAALRADPAARAVVIVRDGALVQGEVGTFGADAWDRPTGAVRAVRVPLGADASPEAPFLGLEPGGAPLFALDALPGGDPPPGTEPLNLRAAAAILPAEDAGLLGYASGLLHWHRATRFCGKCGASTAAGEGGHVRSCRNGHSHHPRTDPVVIMLVTDGERVLMGRQAAWPERRYSALAGFVEPGESLEEAVAREVLEETGVQVGDVRYASSQPWPFPASLMLGFEARYAGGEPSPRDGELQDVTWFTREQVAAAAAEGGDGGEGGDGRLLLPPRLAIARRLVDAWIGS